MKTKKMVFSILFILIGVLLMMAPHHLAPVCNVQGDGHFMKCHWMGQAVIGQGLFMIIMGVVFALVKERGISKGISLANIVVGIITILLSLYLIGGCKMEMMSCNSHTKPTVLLLSGGYIFLNILYLILNRTTEK